ncbi:hypothetical protein O6H91_07G018600 [Diphasiastrum complanatum]|uniref:Uncharacterized protein n=1 Tax=Diphasiastrum complanatum TaxID=34168 RepID=A0ACC2D2S0_DIPCM|nr:hypothetical protein O6H91_07G018600 [Diphasiastrum complanatum]
MAAAGQHMLLQQHNSKDNANSCNKVKLKVCRRCKQMYDTASNSSTSCRFHTSMFVCRRHDDQKRYYELGPDDPPYAAKFYDCCGAEDPHASGCTAAFHVSYDD